MSFQNRLVTIEEGNVNKTTNNILHTLPTPTSSPSIVTPYAARKAPFIDTEAGTTAVEAIEID